MPLLLVVLCAACGCQSRVPVSGKVVDNGQPVAGAELRWVLQGSSSEFVSGASDNSGVYVLDAAGKSSIPTGKYEVTIIWWRTRDGRPLPEGEEGTAMKGTPKAKQYMATVDVEVTGATSNLDIDVTGKGKPVEEE